MAKPKKKAKPEKDEVREERILMEIIPDAQDGEERAMGWYGYLEETLDFPFLTSCIAERAISPLRVGDEVELIGLAPEGECRHEIFVEMPWEKRPLAVPLSQLKFIHGDDQTREAVEDWHYWVGMGYEF
jgi:Calcium binding